MNEIMNDIHRRMSDLVTDHVQLVTLLPRIGIPLGFGERSVADVCARHGVDPQFLLLICNVYCNPHYEPEPQMLAGIHMDGLVPYLRGSHAYYVDNRLPHIARHLDHIATQLPERVAAVFKRFFEEYQQEVIAHFAHEEQVVFPHIEALTAGRPTGKYSIDSFLRDHSNLEDKLNDLLQIIFKYLPENVTGDDTVSVIYDIILLAHDLNRHSFVEEHVMVPYVRQLEKSNL